MACDDQNPVAIKVLPSDFEHLKAETPEWTGDDREP
jgi:hypothetical protein